MTETVLIYASRRAAQAGSAARAMRFWPSTRTTFSRRRPASRSRNCGRAVTRSRCTGTQPAAGLGFEAAESPFDPAPSTFGPGEHYYLVNFAGPIKPEWLADIEQHGGRLAGARASARLRSWLWRTRPTTTSRRRPYVDEVRHYGADYRISPDVAAMAGDDPAIARGVIRGEATAGPRITPSVESCPNTFTVRFFEQTIWSGRSPRSASWAAHPASPRPASRSSRSASTRRCRRPKRSWSRLRGCTASGRSSPTSCGSCATTSRPG